jgi:thiol-disulfide isomerase/thioredoxin
MRPVTKAILIFAFFTLPFTFCTFGQAPAKPYNENQDPRADLKKATELAKKENKHVLVQFGGNWCSWCMRFHALVNGTPNSIFKEFDYPNRFGYPVFVILDKNGKRLNTQDSDSFEHRDPNVKGYDTTKVARFLTLWTPKALDPATYTVK